MDSTTHGYSHWGCVRIALREAGPKALELIMVVLPYWVALAAFQGGSFWGPPMNMVIWLPAAILVQVAWRWWRLRGVAVVFDGEHLHMVGRDGVRGLAAYEVAAYLNTSRYLHIVPGRPDYEMTIHSELDGFEQMREGILAWLPPSAVVVPEPARQRLRLVVRSGLQGMALVVTLLLAKEKLGLNPGDFMIFLVAMLFVMCAWTLYRAWRAEPPPEERYNLPREFVW